MTETKEITTIDLENVEVMAAEIAKFADEKKAQDIVGIDLRGISPVSDYFMVMQGNNRPQIKAIADSIEHGLAKLGRNVYAISGYQDAEWILMDYGNMIIHVFSTEQREYFDLETLWQEATVSKFTPAE